MPNAVYAARKIGDGLIAEQHVGEPAKERERADRDRERRQVAAHDHEAVERGPRACRPPARCAITSGMGKPMCQSTPINALDAPSTEATDRSISAATMISVIGSAINAISVKSASMFERFAPERNIGDSTRPTAQRDNEHDHEHRLPLQVAAPRRRAGRNRV